MPNLRMVLALALLVAALGFYLFMPFARDQEWARLLCATLLACCSILCLAPAGTLAAGLGKDWDPTNPWGPYGPPPLT